MSTYTIDGQSHRALEEARLEHAVAEKAPSLVVAYLLAILLGWISAHRFYLRRPGTAFLQILSWVVLIQPLWWLIDLCTLPSMVKKQTDVIRAQERVRLFYEAPAPALQTRAPPALVPKELVDRLIAEGHRP